MIPIRERFQSIKRRLQRENIHTRVDISRLPKYLQPTTGTVNVISFPPRAKIYVDDIYSGILSSAMMELEPGIHTIKLTLDGYKDFIFDPISIYTGSIDTIFAIMIAVGSLSITSDPLGAEFGLYTGESGTTNTIIPNLPVGINAYEAGLEGYTYITGSFVIEKGKITNLHIPLIPYTDDMNSVFIESNPMGAKIIIDNTDIGAYTTFMTQLAPGTHKYRLELKGYKPASGEFTIVTGSEIPAIVSVDLQSESSAAAALLVGGTAVGMMLLSK